MPSIWPQVVQLGCVLVFSLAAVSFYLVGAYKGMWVAIFAASINLAGFLYVRKHRQHLRKLMRGLPPRSSSHVNSP